MSVNAKFTMKLSLDSIKEYEVFLKNYKDKVPKAAENIVTKVSKIGLKDNYNSTETIPTSINSEGKIIGGIRTTNEIDTYKEFGTGVVGSNSPHVAEWLTEAGWKYDVNEHGEKGWIYPKEDGTFGWTKGIAAQKKFYNAIKNMEESFKNIAIQEFQKNK